MIPAGSHRTGDPQQGGDLERALSLFQDRGIAMTRVSRWSVWVAPTGDGGPSARESVWACLESADRLAPGLLWAVSRAWDLYATQGNCRGPSPL